MFRSDAKPLDASHYHFSLGILFLIWIGILCQSTQCYSEEPEGSSSNSNKTAESKINNPEEEDFSGTPFTEYGEFNQANEEEEGAKFFQFGRFFGVSLGLGYQSVDGNRGALWQGGFPVVDFKLHYWFNFNVAIDIGFRTTQNYFNTQSQNLGHVDVNIFWAGLDLKYYFDTKDLSAPISFANPYLILGFGSFYKTQTSNTQQTQDNDASIGVSMGGGLEFTVSPGKVFFEIEGKMHIATFKDTYTTLYQSIGLPNLTGNFYSLTGNFLFVW